jgi:hypothetical protein
VRPARLLVWQAIVPAGGLSSPPFRNPANSHAPSAANDAAPAGPSVFCVAGNRAQCRILFPPQSLRIILWGGPPGGCPLGPGTPSSRPCVKNQSAANTKEPTRGSAADEGVRPTICAIARKREKYVAGNRACRRAFRPPPRNLANFDARSATDDAAPAGLSVFSESSVLSGFDFVLLRASVSPKKQNLWLLETKDLAYPNTEAKNRPAQPSFFPHQTGRAQSVALW